MDTINISAMFITASKRTLDQLTHDAGFTNPSDTVNHALVTLKSVKDAWERHDKIVVLHPDTQEACEIENLTLDSQRSVNGLISMSFPAGHDEYLKSVFKAADSASVVTEAFYVYDRLVTAAENRFEIAAVDNPLNISKIHYIQIGPASPS